MMPTYVLLSTLTEKGRHTIHDHPQRMAEVNVELERMGIRVIHQWALLGPYDFVNIVEAPDNDAIARASLEMTARGTVKLMTMPALPMEVFKPKAMTREPVAAGVP